MTDTDDQDRESDKEKTGRGKAGSGEKQGGVVVSDGFYAYMTSIGASVSQIASILKAWRHLRGVSLIQALKDFAGRRARASAHAEVEIKRGSDFGLLHNFFSFLKSTSRAPEQKISQDQTHHHKAPGQGGPGMG